MAAVMMIWACVCMRGRDVVDVREHGQVRVQSGCRVFMHVLCIHVWRRERGEEREMGEVRVSEDALSGPTLVPVAIAQNLVTAGHGFVNVVNVVDLLDFCVVALGVSAEMVERGGVQTLLDGGDVEGWPRGGGGGDHVAGGCEGAALISTSSGGASSAISGTSSVAGGETGLAHGSGSGGGSGGGSGCGGRQRARDSGG